VIDGYCATAKDTSLWISEDEGDRAEAARLCLRCPAITECGIGAIQRKETFGVWGGRDITGGSKPGPKPRALEPKGCEQCGEEFEATWHGPADWAKARFCGNTCANRFKRQSRKSVAA